MFRTPTLAGLLVALLLAACGSQAERGGGEVTTPEPTAETGQDEGRGESGPSEGERPTGPNTGRCERAALGTASLTLLESLRSELASLPSSERAGRVDRFLAEVDAQGGTPLVAESGNRVAFVHRGTPTQGYSVAGTFNGWQPGTDRLTALEGTDLYVSELAVPRNQAHAYKLVDGAHWFEDRLARNVVWDGIDHRGVGEFNAIVFPALQEPTQGRLVAWRGVRATRLGDARDVFVYLPAAYDAPSCPSLPTLYFHDGNESLTRVSFAEAAERAYAEKPGAAAVLVFVALPSQEVRLCEYTFGSSCDFKTGDPTVKPRGPDYVSFLKDDLLPRVESEFRVSRSAEARGIAGASLGGLISTFAAFEYPELFGFVGTQSGSFWWERHALIRRAQETPRLPVRWYVDHGCPGDNCEENQALVTALREKGYAVTHVVEQGGAHDWANWAKRLPGMLHAFRESQVPSN